MTVTMPTLGTGACLLLGLLAAGGCRFREVNPNHCNNNDGDAYCAEQFPDGSRPYCEQGEGSCISDSNERGCVAERPEDACYSPCGQGSTLADNGECVATESSSGSTDGGMTETGETGVSSSDGGQSSDSGSSTTGPMPCAGNEDCTDAAAPFCDPAGECVDCGALADGNGACAEADPELPVCDAGVCVACTDQDPGACGGQTPVCGEDNLCRACVEHSECPGTACHLDGPMVGGCFEMSEVVPIANATALTNAIAGLGASGRAVFVLQPGTYGATINAGSSIEIAILGDGSQILAGSGSTAVDIFSNAIVYLAGVQVVNGSGDGVACSATSVWVDDSRVRNNAQAGVDISGGCAAHLRRSVVGPLNGSGGIVAASSPVILENTAVGENVDTQDIAGVQITNGELRMRYSTVVANLAVMGAADSIQCFGSPTIDVRNSIVMAAGNNSINGCGMAGWTNNALDTNLDSVNTPRMYNAGWFDPAEGDYHLTSAGATALADLASWQPGDPLSDFDGEPIVTDMPSFPGYDQP